MAVVRSDGESHSLVFETSPSDRLKTGHTFSFHDSAPAMTRAEGRPCPTVVTHSLRTQGRTNFEFRGQGRSGTLQGTFEGPEDKLTRLLRSEVKGQGHCGQLKHVLITAQGFRVSFETNVKQGSEDG